MALPTELLPLGILRAGQQAIVEEICVGCEREASRLAAMGFVPGAMVRMMSAGRGVAVQVGEARLVLRGEQLQGIMVSPL
jgi:Fe2+ transport system protein FeoA